MYMDYLLWTLEHEAFWFFLIFINQIVLEERSCGHRSRATFFLTERVINTWNHPEATVVDAETLNTFKVSLKRYMTRMSQCLDGICSEASSGELIIFHQVV